MCSGASSKLDLLRSMKETTLVYIIDEQNRLLLGRKKRSHGAGFWNGPGGKLDAEESAEECARREVEEEVGLVIGELEARGVIEFEQEGSVLGPVQRCYVFVTHRFTGTPIETNEMEPGWFDIDDLPWDKMWPADNLWLPGILAGGMANFREVMTADNELVGIFPLVADGE